MFERMLTHGQAVLAKVVQFGAQVLFLEAESSCMPRQLFEAQ